MTPKPKTMNDWLYIELANYEKMLYRAVNGDMYYMPLRNKTRFIRRCKRIIYSIRQLLIVQGLNPDKKEPTVEERINALTKLQQ